MNRERLTKLAQWLQAGAPHKRVQFNMNLLGNFSDKEGNSRVAPTTPECTAACCIAGAAAVFFGTTDEVTDAYRRGGEGWRVLGARLLEMDYDEACKLFYPDSKWPCIGPGYEEIKPEDAAKVIHHLLETGLVDWSVAGLGFITKR